MAEETANENIPGKNNLEKEEPSGLQKKIEEKIAEDEKNLQGEVLSGELSKDRTHMSEHRTKMSEHRTDLSEHRTGLSEKRTGMSVTRTNLSFERTALSYERTLMSWIRTATSLISFGFTIYKFFEEFQKKKSAVQPIAYAAYDRDDNDRFWRHRVIVRTDSTWHRLQEIEAGISAGSAFPVVDTVESAAGRGIVAFLGCPVPAIRGNG